MPKSFYITTTLPYVNADPHVGFALEIVQADAVARYKRLEGREVFFSTGTDEHGQKIYERAAAAGQDVQAYADRYAAEFRKLKAALGLSNDVFIRTTDAAHKAAAQEMWRRCDKAGDIYKKSYQGAYCVGCESFKTEKDLNANGQCLVHPHLEISMVKEENYFFRFSKYQDKLLQYLAGDHILPEWRRDEAVNFVKGGLEDFSISREKERLSWGVPVPGDESQVMYVWFDALTNYISTLGWPSDSAQGKPQENLFEKFWVHGETVQAAGKDQVRFQSLMWQAMLMSAGIKNTDKVVYHGFINSGGQKMSKSLGNVINPLDLVAEYGTEAVRYFLLRHVHPFEDSDVTLDKIKEAYNAGLANGLGNLTSRIMKMAVANLDGPVDIEEGRYDGEFMEHADSYNFQKAMDLAWSWVGELDAMIQEKEPFKLVKTDPAAAKKIIATLVAGLADIASHLVGCMPETSEKILTLIREHRVPDAPLFLRKD